MKWSVKTKSKIVIGESLETKDWNYRSLDKINDLGESTLYYKWTIYCYQLLTYPPEFGHVRQFSLLRTGTICPSRFKPSPSSLILFFEASPRLFRRFSLEYLACAAVTAAHLPGSGSMYFLWNLLPHLLWLKPDQFFEWKVGSQLFHFMFWPKCDFDEVSPPFPADSFTGWWNIVNLMKRAKTSAQSLRDWAEIWVQAPMWTKCGTGSWGSCEDIFRASPRYPWANYQIRKCLHGALLIWEPIQGSKLQPTCSWERLSTCPVAPNWIKWPRKRNWNLFNMPCCNHLLHLLQSLRSQTASDMPAAHF